MSSTEIQKCPGSQASTALKATGSIQTSAAQIVSSEALLRGQSAVAIEHNGSLYRLQATKQGKLILTK